MSCKVICEQGTSEGIFYDLLWYLLLAEVFCQFIFDWTVELLTDLTFDKLAYQTSKKPCNFLLKLSRGQTHGGTYGCTSREVWVGHVHAQGL